MENVSTALLVVPDNGDKEFLLTFSSCQYNYYICKLKYFNSKGFLVKSFVLTDGFLELDHTYNEKD